MLDKAGTGNDVAPVMKPAAPPTCPMCNAPLSAESHPWRPFCSKRCKLLDLSRWLSEEYRVPGEAAGDGAVQASDDEETL